MFGCWDCCRCGETRGGAMGIDDVEDAGALNGDGVWGGCWGGLEIFADEGDISDTGTGDLIGGPKLGDWECGGGPPWGN